MNKHNNACSNFPIHHFSNRSFKRKQILLKHVNYDVDGFVLDSSKFSIINIIVFNFSYHRNTHETFFPILNDNDMLQIISCNVSFNFANDIYMK